jgi:hypothetical protein
MSHNNDEDSNQHAPRRRPSALGDHQPRRRSSSLMQRMGFDTRPPPRSPPGAVRTRSGITLRPPLAASKHEKTGSGNWCC